MLRRNENESMYQYVHIDGKLIDFPKIQLDIDLYS